MPLFSPAQGQSGTLQGTARKFVIQPGILHLTEGDLNDLTDSDKTDEETVQKLGGLGITTADDTVVDALVHRSEDPADIIQLFLSTQPNDPATIVRGTRI